ncbi:MAG: N-acetyltransferase [Anaerolineae bacterium]|nr:hypothetical protein [Thermoflexales bacterium]MDW8394781.1 N-acetyltransferase [Anaerolineae bacterium]
MSSKVEVVECRTAKERRQFIEFQWEVYKNNPYWVPPLISERMAFYDKAKNPFFEHSDAALFVARRNGQVQGTIVAIQNNRHNQFHNERTGFFGGFECVNDFEVACALFNAARDWVKARGMTVLRGPTTLSFNDEIGLLIQGFDKPPRVLMPYNPPYYAELVEQYGFKKAMDVCAWWVDTQVAAQNRLEQLERVAAGVRRRKNITVRNADFKQLDREIAALKRVYASEEGAWRDNWGHVPMTDHELEHTVNNLKQFADPDFIFIAEVNAQPVGIAVSLPDVNRPLRAAYPNPKTPELWTLIKFLWYRHRMVNAVRFILLGTLAEYRTSGVEALLVYETLEAVRRRGYIGGELGWVLETNEALNRINRAAGAVIDKVYRIYDLPIA